MTPREANRGEVNIVILNIETNVDAKFWGQTRCIMVYVKMVNQ